MRVLCAGSTRSRVRAAYRPPKPPPAITMRWATTPEPSDVRRKFDWSLGRQVLEHRAGRQVAGRSGDRAAGMGSRPGQVQALQSAEAAGGEAVLQQLAGKHLAVEDVARGDPEAGLQLGRAQAQTVDDALGQAGADLGEACNRRVGRRLR